MKDLGLVIPTFFAGKLLIRSLDSAIKSAELANVNLKIVVVDCHPQARDKKNVPAGVSYISLPHNPGFGTAANTGFKMLFSEPKIEHIILLNPDAFLKENFITTLRSTLANEEVKTKPIAPLILFSNSNFMKLEIKQDNKAVITEASKFLNDEDIAIYDKKGSKVGKHSEDLTSLLGYSFVASTNSSCFAALKSNNWEKAEFVQNASSFYHWPDLAGDIGFGLLNTNQYSGQSQNAASWCGAGVVLSRSYLQITGGFDERFFLYYEDTELAVRGANLGLAPIFIPELIIYHEHSSSTGKNQRKRAKAIWTSRALFSTIIAGRSTTLTTVLSRFLRQLIEMKPIKWLPALQKYLLPELFFSLKGFGVGIIRKPQKRIWKNDRK